MGGDRKKDSGIVVDVLQLNLGRSKLAHDIAFDEVLKKNIDIMVISEPNKKIAAAKGWITDVKENISVAIINSNLEIGKIIRGDSFVLVQTSGIYVIAVYISPNVNIEVFNKTIDTVFELAAEYTGRTIIVRDINAKSALWGSPITDIRGKKVEEWLTQLITVRTLLKEAIKNRILM